MEDDYKTDEDSLKSEIKKDKKGDKKEEIKLLTSAETKPKTPAKSKTRNIFKWLLISTGVLIVLAIITGLVGYIGYQYILQTPQYALYKVFDITKTSDQSEFDSWVDKNKLIENQVTLTKNKSAANNLVKFSSEDEGFYPLYYTDSFKNDEQQSTRDFYTEAYSNIKEESQNDTGYESEFVPHVDTLRDAWKVPKHNEDNLVFFDFDTYQKTDASIKNKQSFVFQQQSTGWRLVALYVPNLEMINHQITELQSVNSTVEHTKMSWSLSDIQLSSKVVLSTTTVYGQAFENSISPKDGKQFVTLTLNVKNKSDKNHTYAPYFFALVDEKNDQYQSFPVSESDYKNEVFSVEAGQSASIKLIYTVPVTTKNLKMLYVNPFSPSDEFEKSAVQLQ